MASHEVLELLNEPRNRKHMPLSTTYTPAAARSWVAQKDAQWDINGYRPRAAQKGVVQRWGFRPAGEVIYSGVTFRPYRLARRDWPPS